MSISEITSLSLTLSSIFIGAASFILGFYLSERNRGIQHNALKPFRYLILSLIAPLFALSFYTILLTYSQWNSTFGLFSIFCIVLSLVPCIAILVLIIGNWHQVSRLTEDVILDALTRAKIIALIEKRKEDFRYLIVSLYGVLEKIYPSQPVTGKKIEPLIWDAIKYEPPILSLFFTDGRLIGKWETYGDPFSQRIVAEILHRSGVDSGDITIKKQHAKE